MYNRKHRNDARGIHDGQNNISRRKLLTTAGGAAIAATMGLTNCAMFARTEPPCKGSSKAVALFDGKTFAGWEGNLEMFRIEDGAIVAGTLEGEIPRNEYLCTVRSYGDFELRLQVKTLPYTLNAGIQFRSWRVPNSNEVLGYQADVGALQPIRLSPPLDTDEGADGGIEPTLHVRNIWGALYDEFRGYMLALADQEQIGRVYHPEDWNDYVIRAEGDRVQIWINGYQTVDYTETAPSIVREGIIGLQIHDGLPGEAHYRNIVIEEIASGKP
jgi:hypothetical protein